MQLSAPLSALVLPLAAFATLPGCCQTPHVRQPPSSLSQTPTSQNAVNRHSGIPAHLSPPIFLPSLAASCDPPLGWIAQPPKSSPNHIHQVWLSPTGRTAYGVIHFHLPLPVGQDLALWGFLQQMKATEGSAILFTKSRDPNLPGLRFVAKGGIYRVRVNLIVRGWEGWAIYAGSLIHLPEQPDELRDAEAARDATVLGDPAIAQPPRPPPFHGKR